jgi:hypothetical protein
LAGAIVYAAAPMRHSSLLAWLFVCVAACAPELGDSCKNATDCSIQGTRTCDKSQPGGYCTIANCDKGGCGSGGVCVRFRPDEPRVSSSYCMRSCSSTGDCDRDDYVCRSSTQLNEERGGLRVAEVLDSHPDEKFCVTKD